MGVTTDKQALNLYNKPIQQLTKSERRQLQEIKRQEILLENQQKKERQTLIDQRFIEQARQERNDLKKKQLKEILENPKINNPPNMELSDEAQQQLQANIKFILQSGSFLGADQINQNQTIFFRVGNAGCSFASICTFISASMKQGKLTSYWCPIDDPKYIEEVPTIHFDDQMKHCLHPESLKYINKIGKFIIHGTKWGFLLDLNTLADIYQGNLGDFWQNILKLKFFQQKFRTFAEFQQEEENIFGIIKEFKIKTTHDDEPFFTDLFPFSKQMFSHQKQETGWMFAFENKKQITFPVDPDAVPLLDSGYYFYPAKPLELITRSKIKSKNYKMPGAILGSQIGSGKTLSIIALTALGHEIKNLNQNKKKQKNKNKNKNLKYDIPNQMQEEQKEESKEDYQEKKNIKKQQVQFQDLNLNNKTQNPELVNFSDDDDFNKVDEFDDIDKFNQNRNKQQLLNFDNNSSSDFDDPFAENLQMQKKISKEELSSVSFQQKKEDLMLKKKQSHIEKHNQQIFIQKQQIYTNQFDGVYLPSLVVVTQNILFQWKEEYQKFAPHLKVQVIENMYQLKEIKTLNIKGISGNKYVIYKDIDILLTHRNVISNLDKNHMDKKKNYSNDIKKEKHQQLREINCKIEAVNFKRIVFDEFHEITNIHKSHDSKSYINHCQYQDANFDINNFYKTVERIQKQFTWGITGTIENLDYVDDNKSMALLLGLPKDLYDSKGFNFAIEMKKQFVKNCIRSNPRCIQLPELQKEVVRCKQSKLQNLLYRGIINGKGIQKAREICSFFMKEYQFIQKNLKNVNQDKNFDQFEYAIQVIQSKLDADIQQAQNEYEFEKVKHEKNVAYEMDKNIVSKYENLLSENNFYSDVLNLLNTDKFLFDQESTHNDLLVLEKKKNVSGKQLAQIKQPKLTLMEPFLKMGNKYEYKFRINGLNDQEKMAIGIYRKYQEYENYLDEKAKEHDIMISKSKNKINSHYYSDEEIKELSKNGVNLKYQRLVLFKENIMDDEFIYDFTFRINQLDGKNLLGIGMCDKNLVEQENYRHEKFLSVPEWDDDKKKIPFNRNKLLNHGMYMIRADGMIYSSHDLKINKYFKNISFSLGDTVSMQINPKLGLIKIKNINQQVDFQFQYLPNQQNKKNMLPFIALYSNNDEIQILETKKQRQLNTYTFDGFNIDHGAYMVSAEGDILSDHDQKLNKTFQKQFNFKKGHTIQMSIDLQENFIHYKNLNNNSSYQLNIKNDSKFHYNLAVLMHDQNDHIECIDQIFVFECPLCLEEIGKEEMVVTNCLHQFCNTCYKSLNKKIDAACPYCKQFIGDNQVLIQPIDKNQPKQPEFSKMDIILQNIQKVPEDEKIIIFTQFNTLTEHIAKLFDEINLSYLILTGEPTKINIKLNKFKKLDTKILIMSVEQAASGINITEANHIYFVHPIFGMMPEKAEITYAQCIGRAYRIGQTKPVNVKLFASQYTIEENELSPYLEDLFKEKQLN